MRRRRAPTGFPPRTRARPWLCPFAPLRLQLRAYSTCAASSMQLRPHNHAAVCTLTGPHSVTLAAMASREIVSVFELQPRRDLTLLHATSLVVGITIGTGIFLKS